MCARDERNSLWQTISSDLHRIKGYSVFHFSAPCSPFKEPGVPVAIIHVLYYGTTIDTHNSLPLSLAPSYYLRSMSARLLRCLTVTATGYSRQTIHIHIPFSSHELPCSCIAHSRPLDLYLWMESIHPLLSTWPTIMQHERNGALKWSFSRRFIANCILCPHKNSS